MLTIKMPKRKPLLGLSRLWAVEVLATALQINLTTGGSPMLIRRGWRSFQPVVLAYYSTVADKPLSA